MVFEWIEKFLLGGQAPPLRMLMRDPLRPPLQAMTSCIGIYEVIAPLTLEAHNGWLDVGWIKPRHLFSMGREREHVLMDWSYYLRAQVSDYTGLPICDATGLPMTVDRFDVAFLWKSAEPQSRLGGVILPDVQVDVDGVYITTIVKEMSIILHLGRSMIVVE